MKIDITPHSIGHEGLGAIALNPINNRDIVVSCEDNSLILLNTETFQSTNESISVPCYITALSWQPLLKNSYCQEESTLATGYSDGNLILFKPANLRSGYSIQGTKKFRAHQGAVTSVHWSCDGSSLLSSGEDGEVKVWSKTGHLRSTLGCFGVSVNCTAWHGDNYTVVVAHGSSLSVHNIQTIGETIEWKATGEKEKQTIILSVDWSHQSNLIVCGGEDGHCRMFDSRGVVQGVYSVSSFPITKVVWMPNGDIVVIGSFDSINLCNTHGDTVSQINLGIKSSVMDITCKNDSSQIYASCSSGVILVGHIAGKVIEYNGIVAEQIDSNQIRLDFMKNESSEIVQAQKGPIIDFKIACKHMLIFTETNCQIHPLLNVRSVSVVDHDGMGSLTSMSRNSFAISNKHGILVYSYSGRKLSSIQCNGFKSDKIDDACMSVSRNLLALVDTSDRKIVRLFDCTKGLPLCDGSNIHHEFEVQCVSFSYMNHKHNASEQLALLDENKDLFIFILQNEQSMSACYPKYKIGSHVDSFCWNETSYSLVLISESKVTLFHYPSAPFIDIDLLADTTEYLDIQIKEKDKLVSFHGAHLFMKCPNGHILESVVAEDTHHLYENALASKWKECFQFCRYVDRTPIWAAFACLALNDDNLEMAEVALTEIKRVDKIDLIKHIHTIQDQDRKHAEIQLLKGNRDKALEILLQHSPPFTYHAIEILIHSFQWERALDIATNTGDDFIDIVTWYRVKYLQQIESSESSPRFQLIIKQRGIISCDTLLDLKAKYNAEKLT